MTAVDHLAEARLNNPGGLPWREHDGGRAEAGFRGKTGDCVTRAVAIALGLDYRLVYTALAEGNREHWTRKAERAKNPRFREVYAKRAQTTARNGVPDEVTDKFMAERGWVRVPMPKGSRLSDLPTDRMIVARLKGHLAAVDHGVILDTWDSGCGYNRLVFGYWRPREQW